MPGRQIARIAAAAHHHGSLSRADALDHDLRLVPAVEPQARLAHGIENRGSAIDQPRTERRFVVRHLCDRLGLAAIGGDPHDPLDWLREDDVIALPVGAGDRLRLAHGERRAAGDGNFLDRQVLKREEPYPLPVWREEWTGDIERGS